MEKYINENKLVIANGKVTYEIMIPNVIKLPSIIIKLPRLAMGEHSAWYDGTVEVFTSGVD